MANAIPDFLLPPDSLEMLAVWEPSATSQAAFYSGLDMASGTVRVMGAGIWREADADRYFLHQRAIVTEARRRFGALKVFFDVRHWVVEGPHSATQFQDANSQIYRPDDRLVSVVASSLDKKHPRTALSVGAPESFLSLSAAETWLQAYSRNRVD
jgi:hypothetical protein